MFASTVLLSICAMSHNDEETNFLINRLDQQGVISFASELSESSEQRRLEAPVMGVEGGPCRDGWQYSLFGYRCNWGLYCERTWDGSAEYGICRSYWHPGNPDIPIHEATGEAGQKCNPAPESPCNSNNLRPRYQQLYGGNSCTCEYNLLGANNDQGSVGSTASTNTQSSSPTLGMRAPEMGGLGQPCRNTPGYECNDDLHCHYYTLDGTSTMGRCVRTQHHHTGGENQRCNDAPLAPCNNDDLQANWERLLPSGEACTCVRRQSQRGGENQRCNDAPLSPCNTDDLKPHYERLLPTGTACSCVARQPPTPQRGEAGGRCNNAPLAPCNRNNLQPHYQRLLPSGTSCTCEYLLLGENSN